MKRILFLFLVSIVLLSCRKQESCLTLHERTDTIPNAIVNNVYVDFCGYTWGVCPAQNNYAFEVVLLDAANKNFSKIVRYISREFGDYTYDLTTLPKDLVPNTMNNEIFLIWEEREIEDGEAMYWWVTDNKTIRLYSKNSYDFVAYPKQVLLSIYDTDLFTQCIVESEDKMLE